MKTMNRSTRLLLAVTGIVVVATMWMASAWSREAAAEEYLDEFLAYGVANISPGQTARLHVVTVGIPDAHSAELVIYDTESLLALSGREKDNENT